MFLIPPKARFAASARKQGSGGGATDPDFADVSLLLHMDGSNGSTTFTDSSSNALTVTANGNAQISTAESKFGGSSALLDGTGDYLSAGVAAFDPGTSDFTIEWWQKLSATNVSYSAISLGAIGGVRASDGLIQLYTNGGFATNVAANAVGVNNTDWNYIAISRTGTTCRIFLNGTLLTNDAANAMQSNLTGVDRFDIGRNNSSYGNAFNGYIDELRVTVGTNRYTANFTPPTAPFPDS